MDEEYELVLSPSPSPSPPPPISKPSSRVESASPTSIPRRSIRKKPSARLTAGYDEGFKLVDVPGKGRGVVAEEDILLGDFTVEYAGDLIERGEAERKEKEYEKDPTTGSFMFFFREGSKRYCLDATQETLRLGRLINHSSKMSNIKPKIFMLDKEPRLVFFASRKIFAGEELLFDYGDRSKLSLLYNSWLGE